MDVERRSQEEALEVGVVLSEQEGQVDLREKQGHQTKERKNVLDETKSNKYSHKQITFVFMRGFFFFFYKTQFLTHGRSIGGSGWHAHGWRRHTRRWRCP